MRLFVLVFSVGWCWMAVHQARAAYGLNDADGWPFCKAETRKGSKLAYAAWLAIVSVVALVAGLLG